MVPPPIEQLGRSPYIRSTLRWTEIDNGSSQSPTLQQDLDDRSGGAHVMSHFAIRLTIVVITRQSALTCKKSLTA